MPVRREQGILQNKVMSAIRWLIIKRKGFPVPRGHGRQAFVVLEKEYEMVGLIMI